MLYAYLLVVPLLLSLLFLPARVRLEVDYHTLPERTSRLVVSLYWGLHRRGIKIPLYTWTPQADKGRMAVRAAIRKQGARRAFRDVRLLLRVVGVLLRGVELETEARLKFGTGDAAGTGMASGLLWSALGVLQAMAQRMLRRSRLSIRLEPEFAHTCLELDLWCIASVRVTHIISVAAGAVTYLSEAQAQEKWRGGRRWWPSILFKV